MRSYRLCSQLPEKVLQKMTERKLTVSTLQELLSKLDPDDILVPNHLGNLIIERNGVAIGFVDTLVKKIIILAELE